MKLPIEKSKGPWKKGKKIKIKPTSIDVAKDILQNIILNDKRWSSKSFIGGFRNSDEISIPLYGPNTIDMKRDSKELKNIWEDIGKMRSESMKKYPEYAIGFEDRTEGAWNVYLRPRKI